MQRWRKLASLIYQQSLASLVRPFLKTILCGVAGLMLSVSTSFGQTVYAMQFNQSTNLFGTIDLLNGSFTRLGSEGSTLFNDVAAAPSGTLYGIVYSSSLVTLNPARARP